ncbi:MAG: hypothetical protein ACJ77N_15340 [Chloroflexota bacterium]
MSGDVVRSAVLTPDGAAVVEHHVDRATRADLGIFRRRIAGGELVRVADPVAWDDAYGATWTTDLVATADGRVVVGSCGQFMCRARVASRDGATRSVDRIGPVIGLLGDDVVAYKTCRGLPCGIDAVATDGTRRAISVAAGRARIADGRLVFEDAIRTRLVVVDASKRTVDLGPLRADRHLVATSTAVAAGGARDVFLSPDGRIPADGIDGSVDRLVLPAVEQEISR